MSTRNTSIDTAKLMAAFGVVMIHLAPSSPVAEVMSRAFLAFAVPYFLAIALYFFIGNAAGRDPVRISQLRLDRIVVPYAAWTVIYLMLRIIKFRVQSKAFHLEALPALFYGGTGVQMYFLPLLLLFQAEALAALLLLRSPRRWAIGIMLILGAAIFGGLGQYESYFGFQGCLAKGVIYVVVAFLLHFLQSSALGRRVNVFVGVLIAAVVGMAAVRDDHTDWPGYLIGPLAGYSIAAMALNMPFFSPGKVGRFVLSCSYGIYLEHFLFIETLQFLAGRMRWELTPYTVPEKLLLSLIISAICMALIWFVRKSSLFAYMLLGESTAPLSTKLPANSSTLGSPDPIRS